MLYIGVWRRRRCAAGCVGLAVGVLSAVAPASGAAVPAVPPTDYLSPYVAAFDAQTPNGDPFRPPRQAGEAATRALFRNEYASGVRWSYTWLPWSSIEQTPGTYSFADLDNYVSWARAEGILLKLQVMTGDWSLPQTQALPLRVNPEHDTDRNVPGVDLEPALDYWAALVARYKPGGVLAREKGWKDGYGVRRWEIENEPACLSWWGNWSQVPKDYAEFVVRISRRVRAIDPGIELSGPALGQTENDGRDGCHEGLSWLRQALDARVSEWSSTTYRQAKEHPVLGRSLDAFSWHFDNASLTDGLVVARHDALRKLVDSFADQKAYPTKKGVPLWYSEGSALAYNRDNAKFATAQVQLMTMILATGTTTMNLEPGTQINDVVGTWTSLPMYGAQKALTTYLPRAGQVRSAASEFPSQVTAFRRDNPADGSRTYVVWADDTTSGTVGPDLPIRVPVRTAQADMVSSVDWKPRRVQAKGDFLTVTSHTDDPSPLVIVAERGAGAGASRAPTGRAAAHARPAARPPHREATATEAAARGTASPLAGTGLGLLGPLLGVGALSAALVVHRRRPGPSGP